MHIDCQRCPARGTGCSGCVVAHFLDVVPQASALHLPVMAVGDGRLPLDAREARVVDAFLAAGLVGAAEAARAHAQRTDLLLAGVG